MVHITFTNIPLVTPNCKGGWKTKSRHMPRRERGTQMLVSIGSLFFKELSLIPGHCGRAVKDTGNKIIIIDTEVRLRY